MKLANVITGIKTAFEAMSWTSDDGTGTTSFNAVFTFPNFEHTDGYPFVCIYETPADGQKLAVRTYQIDNRINIDICTNWSVNGEGYEDAQREEALLRLREAWDYVKTQVLTPAFLTTSGTDIIPSLAYSPETYEEINVTLFRINLTIMETIAV